ncbi:MAG: hypothetical protein ACJARD_000609 [Alphaproteobacteria bacterium]|jgi:hypothetical protein
MGFFQDIGKAFKKGVEAIGKVGDAVVNGIGEAAGWVASGIGEVAEGVTRVVAGSKAADAVGKAFDENIEPAIKRGVKGVANIIGAPLTFLDEVIEHGLIDGVSMNAAESVQDVVGSTARLVGGKDAEKKFDVYYDEKIQRWVEMGIRVVGSAALAVVPGGAAVLAADAVSEVGSLGYRVSQGHKANWFDALEVGGAIVGAGAASKTGKAALTSLKTTLTGGKAAAKTAGKIAVEGTKTTAKQTGDIAAKTLAQQIKRNAKAVKDSLIKNKKEIAKDAAFDATVELGIGNTISNWQADKRGVDLLSLNKAFFQGTPTVQKKLVSDTEARAEGSVFLNEDIYSIENGNVNYNYTAPVA